MKVLKVLGFLMVAFFSANSAWACSGDTPTALPNGGCAPGVLATDCTSNGSGTWCPDAGIGSQGAITVDPTWKGDEGQDNIAWIYVDAINGPSDNYGFFTLPTNQAFMGGSTTTYKHSNCVMSPAETEPAYLGGYTADGWPAATVLYENQHLTDGSGNANGLLSFEWWASNGGVYNLAKGYTYAMHIHCGQNGPTTVSSLPACNSNRNGWRVRVNDQLSAPSYNATLTGGGSYQVSAFCDGGSSTWYQR